MTRHFPQLEAYEPPGRTEAQKERSLEELAASMQESAHEAGDGELDNDDMPAAYAHLAELVEHDVTFGLPAVRRDPWEPLAVWAQGVPRLGLDSLYGGGRALQPYPYDQDGPHGRLLVGDGFDLPRNHQSRALIGDPRNDRNPALAQLHLALIRFHNAALVWAKSLPGLDERGAFREARRQVTWHYQWVVIHDFLKRLVGGKLVSSLLPSPEEGTGKARLTLVDWRHGPSLPIEFHSAVYLARYSMTRQSYELNELATQLPLLASDCETEWPEEFGTSRALPMRAIVQWDRFLSIDGSRPQASRRLNTLLCSGLFAAAPQRDGSLAKTVLMRGWRLGLPSGQDVARAMGRKPIRAGHDPLWLYVLSEAECAPESGRRLVGIGAQIVAEVLIGLLASDPNSYVNRDPTWQPHFCARGAAFDLSDLLRFAEMPLKREDLPLPAGAAREKSRRTSSQSERGK